MAAEGQGSHNCRCGLTSLFYTAWSNLGTVPGALHSIPAALESRRRAYRIRGQTAKIKRHESYSKF
jgi:hypothetical protein